MIVASNLTEYLGDDQLLQLKTPILYRIMTKYQLKNKKRNDNSENKRIIDFLFKYLDKYGIVASILFSCIDFGDLKIEYVNRLIKDYQNTFDFHYINSSLVKTLYETNNDLIRVTEKYQIEQEKSFNFIREEIEKIRSEQHQKQGEMLNEIKKLKDENTKIRSEQKQKEGEILNEIKKLKDENTKIRSEQKQKQGEILSEVQMLKDEIKKINLETKQKLNEKDQEIHKIKKELDKERDASSKRITISYKNNEFNGIIKYITNTLNESVNVTSSSSEPRNVPQNVIQYDNLKNYFVSKNIQNSWIQFDFNNHRIIPTNYVIRGPPFGVNSDNPKSWVIEGSNDSSNWVILDSQNDCPYLNGSLYTHGFNINTNKPFKYLRMRSTGPDWCNYYNLCMNSIEFYGSLL